MLSKSYRDERLSQLGISSEVLRGIRSYQPRQRILEAARIAFTIDDEPNSDLIEYIAGYAPRSAVYHHFASMAELLACLGPIRSSVSLPSVPLPLGGVDVASTIPSTLQGTDVHQDDVQHGKQFRVWQKVNGGMRAMTINRMMSRILFLSGIVLYAGEGTKSLKSGRVEVANSSPGILRLYAKFMNGLGIPKSELRARVQIHATGERAEGERTWSVELGISAAQFVKPLLSAPGKPNARHTFTLQLSYANTMLLALLRHWTENVDLLVQNLDEA